MPLSYTNPLEEYDKKQAVNGNPNQAADTAVARRLLATRQAITQGMPQALPEFDSARNRTANQFQAKRTDTQNALQRRFAAMGNLNSGEATKQLALADQANADQSNQAQQDINSQEQQQLAAAREAEAQRAFQQGALDTDNEFKNREFDFNKQIQSGQADLAKKQFERESLDDAFNAAQAHIESSDPEKFESALQNYLAMFNRFTGGSVGAAPPSAGSQPAPAPGRPTIGGAGTPMAAPTQQQPSAIGRALPSPGASNPMSDGYERTTIGGVQYVRPAGSNSPWQKVGVGW
jgi:hypothetical protein